MSTADLSQAVSLKTPAGRKCIVQFPVTLNRLLDAAANQLLLDVSDVRFLLNGSLLYRRRRGDTDVDARVLEEEILIPSGRTIVVVAIPKRCTECLTAAETRRKGRNTGDDPIAPDVSVPTPHPAPSCRPCENDPVKNHCGSEVENDPGLYDYMKQFVFLQGRRGLRQMLYIARNQYGDFPRSLQDHQTMVSIVEYVDRDPVRLRDVLRTILEEEPDLFRWIEANSEIFLAIINSPVHWQDTTSPIWLIRNMVEAYYRQGSRSDHTQRPAMAAVHGGSQVGGSPQRGSHAQPMGSVAQAQFGGLPAASTTVERPLLRRDILGNAGHLDGQVGSTAAGMGDKGQQQLVDESIAAVEEVCEAWGVAKERWTTVPGESSTNVHVVNHLMCSRLREVQTGLLQSMEGYIVSPPPLAVLQRLCELGEQVWLDGEEWLIKQNDIFGAFQHALAYLLFAAGRDLLTDYISANSDGMHGASHKRTCAREGIDCHPLLDPSVGWITPNGPESLASRLREYSMREDVTIVLYTQLAPSNNKAYVVQEGRVYVEPLLAEDTIKHELEDLESLYSVVSTRQSFSRGCGMRKGAEGNWNEVMKRLYKRLISPIGMLLPQPACDATSPVEQVKQVCFIHTWAPKRVPIPFHALLNPVDALPCVLRWAVFVAQRPWHLLLSSDIPWSPSIAQSPAITRLATRADVRRQRQEPESRCAPTTSMVTYLNINGTHCVSFGETTVDQHSGAFNSGPVRDKQGLWQDVPWRAWLGDALWNVRAGVPTHSWTLGRDTREDKCTALLVHEVVHGSPDNDGFEDDVADDLREAIRTKGQFVMNNRGVPYNQSSDLFVSHLYGRESGVGIHRCALLPIFRVAGREPIEVYNSFFRYLTEVENATTAKAYRMALLEAWEGGLKENPWCCASVMLFNYGGAMKTLERLRKEGREPLPTTDEKVAEVNVVQPVEVPGRHTTKKCAKRLPAHRDTSNGRYVEGRAIDVIYDVVLHGLSTSRPEGMVAILDCMIGCIEKNRVSLERSISRRRNKQEKTSKRSSPYSCSRVSPTVEPSRQATFNVAPAGGKVAISKGSRGDVDSDIKEDAVLPSSIRKGKRSPLKRQ